ncbi:Do family serine endopeptidase [Helicobacter bizzozeronii]|uniref:HtrA protease/chaperone protein / Serine protease n=3 Tax=Helicobacter bizzozeronii TaxID=56877 RepID=F8KQY6_HELBC|nr:Do family serine endopeptidase [Helicobacter bizzozeronii]CCB79147.1 HtrA protease/chaperone protein / Serine protease [Helicobacter bizzozeronii CIII-1]
MRSIVLSAVLIASLGATGVGDVHIQNMPSVQKRVGPDTSPNTIYSYSGSVKEATKAVVNISTQKKIKSGFGGMGGMFNDPFFQQFFGDLYNAIPKDRIERALGSGVIIDKKGYIITNNHVINDADKISVTIPGSNKEYTATLVGTDPDSDLAVIKINKDNLPSIKFADSNEILVGDLVFAIGNPFGVGETVTQGIVSALNKSDIGINNYENFIQTDAAINPGNSGGALIDSRGGLVGINTAILSRTGGNHGVGFAIPSNTVKHIAMQLIKTGKIHRGYLGVGIQDVSNELQGSYNGKEGAVVISIEKDSPAKKAGLMIWDLIVEVNGKKIKNAADLRNFIGSLSPHQKVTIKYMRNKQEHVITLILAERKNPNKKETSTAHEGAHGQLSGLKVETLTPHMRKNLRIPDEIQGVLVQEVKDNSKAQDLGFRQGDVIMQIESFSIKSIEDFNRALARYKDTPKRFLVFDPSRGYKQIVAK